MSFDLPEIPIDVTDQVAPFFDALGRGAVLIQRCKACGDATSYEMTRCDTCQSDEFVAEESSGAAKLVTWTVIDRPTHPAFDGIAPYVAGYVELAEGPWLPARILVDRADLRPDLPVKLAAAAASNGTAYPAFEQA